MKKAFLLIFIFFSFLEASYIKKVEVLNIKDRSLSIEEMKNSKEFKRTLFPFIRHENTHYFLKVTFDKSKFDENKKIIEFENNYNYIELEKELPISEAYKNKTLEFSKKDFIETIYIKIYNNNEYVHVNINIYDKKEYIKKQTHKK